MKRLRNKKKNSSYLLLTEVLFVSALLLGFTGFYIYNKFSVTTSAKRIPEINYAGSDIGASSNLGDVQTITASAACGQWATAACPLGYKIIGGSCDRNNSQNFAGIVSLQPATIGKIENNSYKCLAPGSVYCNPIAYARCAKTTIPVITVKSTASCRQWATSTCPAGYRLTGGACDRGGSTRTDLISQPYAISFGTVGRIVNDSYQCITSNSNYAVNLACGTNTSCRNSYETLCQAISYAQCAPIPSAKSIITASSGCHQWAQAVCPWGYKLTGGACFRQGADNPQVLSQGAAGVAGQMLGDAYRCVSPGTVYCGATSYALCYNYQ